MLFGQFCKQFASNELITEPFTDAETASDDIKARAQVLCDIMKPKMDILDKVEVVFIEAALQDPEYVESTLAQYNQGDIPDYLFKKFSETLYQTPFQELTLEQQSIIKTLSAYICVSAQGSNK